MKVFSRQNWRLGLILVVLLVGFGSCGDGGSTPATLAPTVLPTSATGIDPDSMPGANDRQKLIAASKAAVQ